MSSSRRGRGSFWSHASGNVKPHLSGLCQERVGQRTWAWIGGCDDASWMRERLHF